MLPSFLRPTCCCCCHPKKKPALEQPPTGGAAPYPQSADSDYQDPVTISFGAIRNVTTGGDHDEPNLSAAKNEIKRRKQFYLDRGIYDRWNYTIWNRPKTLLLEQGSAP
jgi:hypothetical protein